MPAKISEALPPEIIQNYIVIPEKIFASGNSNQGWTFTRRDAPKMKAFWDYYDYIL